MKTKKYRLLVLASILLFIASTLGSIFVRALTPEEMRELPPKYGGTIIVPILTDPHHVNPGITTSFYGHFVAGQIYNSLMEYHWKTLEPIPELAQSWDISDDGLTYTFHLVENATWHDGVPFTAEDVKYTFEEIIIPFHPRGNRTFGFIEFEVTDQHTVVFHLSHPYAPLINFFTLWYAPIMPKHIYEGTDILNNPHNWEDPVGTGPFILDEWVKGSHIKLVRNPDYWQKGKPYLDEVIFRIIPDDATRLLTFENKELDYVSWDLPLEELERLNNTEGIMVVDSSAFGSQHQILFNLQHPILSDQKVRHAIAHAIDKDLINELVSLNYYQVATGPIPYTSWAYNPDVPKYEYNPELAETLLEEAGYSLGTDGTRFKLEVIVGTTSQSIGIKEMEVVKSMLGEVGIELELKVYDEATTSNLVNIEHDFDMFMIAGLSTAPDPNMISSYLHSSRIFIEDPIPGLWNLMIYNNSRVDELFDTGLIETDFEKRKEIYGELQEIIVEDLPCIWLIAESGPHFYWEEYVGVPAGPYGGARERFDDVWWTGGIEVSQETILEAINQAEQEINEIGEKHDVTEALAKLEEAKEAYSRYEYLEAQQLANEAVELATPPPGPNYLLYGGVVVAIVIVAALLLWYMRR